jgi:hypothetical protein
MKPLPVLTLALNVILLTAVLWVAKRSTACAPVASRTKIIVPKRIVRLERKRETAITTANPTYAPVPFHWSTVESEDYRTYVTNLRAIGCPEGTIGDIICADVAELFARKRNALIGPIQNEFWELMTHPDELEGVVSDKREQLDKLYDEKEELLAELLGPGGRAGLEPARAEYDDVSDRLGFLAREKREQVLAVRQTFNAAWQTLNEAIGKDPIGAAAKMKELNDQRLADLAEILTPEELAEHEIQTSWTAMQLRSRLGVLELSEDEFRKVYALQKDFDDEQVHFAGGSSPEQRMPKDAAEQHLKLQIKEALGERRFADFQRAQRPEFQEIYRVASRYGLPWEAAVRAFEIHETAMEQVRRMKVDPPLQAGSQRERLGVLHDSTVAALQGVFGESAFGTYRRLAGGWLAEINKD